MEEKDQDRDVNRWREAFIAPQITVRGLEYVT